MQHFFSYYPDNQSVTVPDANLIGAFGPISYPSIDREQVLKDAFERPVNSEQLHAIVTPEDTVVIIIDDALEPTPTVFPFFHVITELHRAGVKDSNISVLVANAGHRANSAAEIDRKIGAEMHKKYRVLQTHGEAREQHTFGSAHTSIGNITVTADSHLKDATCIVSISGVYPNRFKGFTGSGSVIFPGLSSEQNMGPLYLHGAEKPVEAVLGVIETDARKVISDLIQYLPSFRFSIDVILDRTLQIAACVTGKPQSAYAVSSDTAQRISAIRVPEPADIIVLDSHPFDNNLLQAMHSLYGALPALKHRGELILVSPLTEQLPAALNALGHHLTSTRNTLIEAAHRGDLKSHPRAAAELIAIAEVFERASLVTIVTHGAGKSDAMKYGFGLRPNVQQAFDEAMQRKGANARVAVISHAGLAFAHS